MLEFGALGIFRSLPTPNVGPQLLWQKIAFPSCPAIKGIFVGGRPLGLTRLNRNESGDLLKTPQSNEGMKYLISYITTFTRTASTTVPYPCNLREITVLEA